MATMTYTGTLVIETCGVCHIVFAMPKDFQKEKLQRRDYSDGWFYCPQGHRVHYLGESDEARLRAEVAALEGAVVEERERARRAEDRAEAKKRQLAAAKGRITKMRKRALAGVCPCCNRQFTQVVRHMASKHPKELAEMQAED